MHRPEPEPIAKIFHETYERLAPFFSYKTREATAVPWDEVPENNKRLMIAVATEVLAAMFPIPQESNKQQEGDKQQGSDSQEEGDVQEESDQQ